ncbi:hypothetical protein VP01_2272g3 [Puccinia sorghi]|uniref:FAR1 domain-containing protein n=1 Tax=Puccinia sorghi TaxID=27349 RepID=A0A0L6VA40_9BASI|nr:hypothetical protein VP01_2272g3 [Puccinia sorghi]
MLLEIKRFTREHGYIIVICCSDKGSRKFFKCDRGGKAEDNKRKGDPRDQSKFSRLIGCLFSAHTSCERGGLVRYYENDYPHHNHPATKDT